MPDVPPPHWRRFNARAKKGDADLLADGYTDDAGAFGVVYAVRFALGEPWLVRGVLVRRRAAPAVLSRVAVEHLNDPTREVTGVVMRDLKWGEIRNEALEQLAGAHERALLMGSLVTPERAARARRASAAAGGTPSRRPARVATDLAFYRHIAERYLALQSDHPDGIYRALIAAEEQRLGGSITHERMRKWVGKATAHGFLGPGARGKVGRTPGPKLRPKEQQ